ncbi:hypothetical protein LXL04_015529 [Taraxacum kok-saghyz]
MGSLSTKWVFCPPNGYVHHLGSLSTKWVVCPPNGYFVHEMGTLSTEWWGTRAMRADSFIRRMVSFRKIERPSMFVRLIHASQHISQKSPKLHPSPRDSQNINKILLKPGPSAQSEQ